MSLSSYNCWYKAACRLCAVNFFSVSDDGKLSFEEFNTYFADGILTTEELQELFYSIDGQQNKWVFDLVLYLIDSLS